MILGISLPVADEADERLVCIYRELRDLLATTAESQYQKDRSIRGAIDALAPYLANVLTERPA